MSGILWFIAAFMILRGVQVAHLRNEVELNPGQDAYFQCQGPRDDEITLLEWNRADYKSDQYVFLYRNRRMYEDYQHESFKGRVDLMDQTIKDGNVSVVLRNITIRDTGTYICQITTRKTESVVHQCFINLRVTTSDVKATEVPNVHSPVHTGIIACVGLLLFIIAVCCTLILYRKKKSRGP